MKPDRRQFLSLGVGLLAVAAVPRSLRREPSLIRRRIPLMGTVAEVAVRHPDPAWAQRGIDAAFAELRATESAMTRFRTDSEVGALNASAGRTTVQVSAATAAVLTSALGWAEASGGRFDPCLGSATELWDFGNRRVPPSADEIRRLSGRELWRTLRIDQSDVRDGYVAGLEALDARVDLGGIAKGHGVDAAADALRSMGIFHGLVNVGGDLMALGTDADHEPWVVGVQSPWEPDSVVHRLRVSDAAIATSGDYVRSFHHGGRAYHHLLDPRTGSPHRGTLRSLTVQADRCIAADAAATALFGADSRDTRAIEASAPAPIQILHRVQETTP